MAHKWKRSLLSLDYPLIVLILLLAVISILSISSATYTSDPSYVGKQIGWYVLGILFMTAVLLFDYRTLAQGRFVYVLYGLGLILLMLVWVPGLGAKVKGAQEWIRIGSFQFQPSELMKIILILTIAKHLAEVKRLPLRDFKTLGKIGLLFAVPFLIILKQPDLGTALVLVGILGSMLLVGGLDWRWIFTGVVMVAIVVGTVLGLYVAKSPLIHVILKPHQIERIQTFLDPASDPTGAGYQLTQSMIAVGSGQLSGKGFHHGTQAQGKWIPEPHNDFIFAVFAEEFGFIGASILLCIFIFVVYRMLRIALRCEDRFGSCIIAGIVGMLVFQVFQNIGMTIGLMPVTGLPLPFISYGGSSLLTQMVAVGLVLNVGMQQKREFLFMD
ncbi:rod shape-determining protein RodA [Polycladomyces subterraneus]|uniref:Peptidoglycan glycosyltransferase RodA n=1 Tax=Polycladomyces subterraneus TaxID=1016997 RepID=A0ABT8IPX4_9BACL|nr:rod shape-determining protein RodA [Polycladomyces subterraneus]MDN4594846.1 rod shape-determining protein RodA [Polycladomyces subterraneus]